MIRGAVLAARRRAAQGLAAPGRTGPVVLVALALGLALGAAACGDDADDGAGPTPPVETTAPPFDDEAAAVYAAVIRHVHEREADDAERIYVRSRAGGERGEEEAVTIPLGVQVELVELLADVAPLDFVDNPEEVIDDHDEATGELRHQGVLLRLGRIDEVTDGHVQVHVALYRTRERESEAVYDVRRRDDDWVVDSEPAPDADADDNTDDDPDEG